MRTGCRVNDDRRVCSEQRCRVIVCGPECDDANPDGRRSTRALVSRYLRATWMMTVPLAAVSLGFVASVLKMVIARARRLSCGRRSVH